jgi:large subunit ribosomal protein L15
MPHKLRKTRKYRGSRTHGWGQIGQHRDHGKSGGRGKSGMHKGKWTYTVKYEPEHFGDKGFKCPTGIGELKTINVGELDQLVDSLKASDKVKFEDGKYIVNLAELGYEKLLGAGKVTKPLMVKATFYSDMASKKISDAGGRVVK